MEIQRLKDEATRSSQLEEMRAINERMTAEVEDLARGSQEIEGLLKFVSQKRERPNK
jgi:cell division protein FtsB